MAEQFLGFGQLSRPDIGLLADGIQNLAEIYKTDQPTALRNIQLRPEILDIIHNVSETISREDLRSVSDLSSLLLTTLHLQKETFERINEQLFDDEVYASTLNRIGVDLDNRTLTGNSTRAENIIMFNGAVQCAGAQYRENVVDDSDLFRAIEADAFVSTSRSSLLNAVKYSDTENNRGYFKYATYPGSIRVRRRSHVNTINVNPLTFIPAPAVVEQPSKRIAVNITNGGSTSKVKFLATENSPLKLPCRLSKGSVKLKFQTPGQFFYGVQIQPQNGKDGDPPGFLAIDAQPQVPDANGTFNDSHTVNIDINGTGYENNYDLYMYLYLNPGAVTQIEFEGLELQEFLDGKDIGLIGFNNLESLKFSGGARSTRIKILPIWLKTLRKKLRTLDISGCGDTWFENSVMRWFDYRETSAVNDFSNLPLYTMTGYLTLPALGVTVNKEGSNYNGGNGSVFQRYFESGVPTGIAINDSGVQQRTPSTDSDTNDFRSFTAIKTLNLGDRVEGKNVRLDDTFPNLTSLNWNGSRYRSCLQGSPPKISNPGEPIELYSITRNGISSSYSIYDIGTSPTVTDNGTGAGSLCHISKYNIKSFRISGDYYRLTSLTGNIGGIYGGTAGTVDDENQWATWYQNTASIDIAYTNSSLKINLQPSNTYWQKLNSLSSYRYVGCVFKPATGTPAINSEPFKCPLISTLDLREWNETSSNGVLPRIGTDVEECNPVNFYMSDIKNLSVFTENGFNYLIPANFATVGDKNDFKLEYFLGADLNNNGSFRIRKNMFEKTLSIKKIDVHESKMTGTFFNIPNKNRPDEPENEKNIELYFDNCDFHDLRNISIGGGTYVARDLTNMRGYNQNDGAGGCILPTFEGRDDAKIKEVTMYNSLPTNYPSGWKGTARDSGTVVSNEHAGNSLTGCTSYVVANTDDDIYYIEGPTNLNEYVLVNDNISKTNGGASVAKVISVSSNRIYTDDDVNISAGTLYFSRSTIDISDWFKNGNFNSLQVFRMYNCRLSGQLNIRKNLPIKVGSDGNPAFDLHNNNISSVVPGSFGKIFQGGNRKIYIDLSENNFTETQIRNMITEILDIDDQRVYTNAKVYLKNCKQNGNGTYTGYTQSELFPIETSDLPDQTINLTRTEVIKVYETVTTTDADGNTSTTTTQVGTRSVTVPGQSFIDLGTPTPYGAGYYKTRTSTRTKDVEHPIGLRLRQKNYINIDLGFTYQTPPTSPVETGAVYGDYAGDVNNGRLATLREVLGNNFELTDLA